MHERHQTNYAKLGECLESLKAFRSTRAKNQLWVFYNNCRQVWTKMDNEYIKCRRLKRMTERYNDLEAEFNETIITFEQWSTMAALSC
jgi:hypothetical protein